jgi:hypothetical protein
VKIQKELIKREIGGETFLVPVGTSVYDANGLFVLTELGAFIWDLLPEAENEAQILEKILEEYDVEEHIAGADLSEFMQKLHSLNIL